MKLACAEKHIFSIDDKLKNDPTVMCKIICIIEIVTIVFDCYFFCTQRIPLIRPRRIAKIAAEIHPEVVNPSIQRSVKNTIKIVIINDMSPKVRKLRGRVSARNTVPMIALTRPNTIATIIAVVIPSTDTHGVKYDASATAIPEITRLRMNLSICRG
jgi:hypothetical protein